MKTFIKYFFGTILDPINTFKTLLKDKSHLYYGTIAIFLTAILYTFTVMGLAAAKARIVSPAWVNIPAQQYYFWEIFFALPVFIIGWLLAAAILHLLSILFKGKGTFESTLALLGFALTIPTFVTWIPETIGTILFVSGIHTQKDWLDAVSRPGFWKIFADAYEYVALAWYLMLFWMAASVSQKLKWKPAVFTGTLTVIIVGFLMVIFIR